jgi:hypothetical protein
MNVYKVGEEMFCTYCNQPREANEAPCPNCGAPSSLLKISQNGTWGTGYDNAPAWGGSGTPDTSFGAQWEQQQVPQLSFENPGSFDAAPQWQMPEQQDFPAAMPSWQQEANQFAPSSAPLPPWQQEVADPSFSAQPAMPEQAYGSGQQQSLVPVPYQGDMALQPAGKQTTVSLQLIPENAIQHLMPAIPDETESTYIPPTFTKPRPLIPRYRAISGLLSVLIVALLLCSGAGYYAKTSGTWDKVVSLYTGGSPKNLTSTSANIPDPPAQQAKDFGPAYTSGIISASLTASVDQNQIAKAPQNIFQIGQTFYLAFNVTPSKTGTVYSKWYTNNRLYQTLPTKPDTVQANKSANISIQQQFQQPTSGMVEIYWNNQFAWRQYFAVR